MAKGDTGEGTQSIFRHTDRCSCLHDGFAGSPDRLITLLLDFFIIYRSTVSPIETFIKRYTGFVSMTDVLKAYYVMSGVTKEKGGGMGR